MPSIQYLLKEDGGLERECVSEILEKTALAKAALPVNPQGS
jgi:hypothetical protein